MLRRLLLAASREGDLVMDPFLGSGTTAIAAALLKRRCVGIDSDAAHLALAKKRLDDAVYVHGVQSELEIAYAGNGTSGH